MGNMSDIQDYEYFDHDADVGIVGRGSSLESAFESAAKAMFAVMLDVEAVKPEREVVFEFEEEDPELALFTWLNKLLVLAREHDLALGKFRLVRQGNKWIGKAWGQPWSTDLERGTEVKGATFTMLSVEQENGVWQARCVVDV